MAKQKQAAFSLEKLAKQLSKETRPPVESWNPDFCGDIDMRIAVDGTWFYMGTPITRSRMVKLFASVLRKDSDDKIYLVTPVEKIGITVDDAPFVATSVEVLGTGEETALVFETNVGDRIIAGPEHPIRVDINKETGEPRPYLKVRGNLEALISRSVFYELVEKADQVALDGATELKIRSSGHSFSLGSWSDA